MKSLFLGVPENFVQLYVALAIQVKYFSVKRLLPWAVFAVAILYALRSLPGPFGLHVPLHTLLMILIVRHLSQGPWSMAVVGALAASLLIVVGEGIVAAPVLSLLGISFSDVLASPVLNIVVGYLADTLLFLVFGYFYLRRRSGRAGID